jgi:hypothetical protein
LVAKDCLENRDEKAITQRRTEQTRRLTEGSLELYMPSRGKILVAKKLPVNDAIHPVMFPVAGCRLQGLKGNYTEAHREDTEVHRGKPGIVHAL